jgi:hypothetical protein
MIRSVTQHLFPGCGDNVSGRQHKVLDAASTATRAVISGGSALSRYS